MIRIAITTGDADGIGQEVSYKALLKIKEKRRDQGCEFYLFAGITHSPAVRKLRTQLLKKYRSHIYNSLALALAETDTKINLRVVIDHSSPPRWVQQAAKACVDKSLHAIATAPLSKTLIKKAGLDSVGHTELLADICGLTRATPRMAFLGREFNVVLATGHTPLKKVASRLTVSRLAKTIRLAQSLVALLPAEKQRLPIGVVGLNPHAGEQGMLGREEIRIFAPAIRECRRQKIRIEGPLVPDAAFLPQQRKRYSVLVAAYHDQGLIAFKAVHGQQTGAHITLGLPIIRTSVDHGTAKDIFGKNKADAGSMFDAIDLAIRLAKVKAKQKKG